MRQKHYFTAALMILSIVQTKAQQNIQQLSGKLTLQQCIETAVSNNLQIREAAYQAQSSKVTYQQTKALQLPYVGGNVTHGINQGRSIDPFTNSYVNQEITFANYNINTSITVWNNASIRNSIKQNELNYLASEQDWQQAKDNITINVILAYLQILSNQEQLDIAKKQVEVTKTQVERLQVLNNSGAIAPSALYDLRGQLGSDELTVLTIKNTLETAKIALAQLLNVQYTTNVELESLQIQSSATLYDGTPDNIYQTASQQLAIVKAADLRIKSAQKGLLSAKGQLWPVLSFNGALGTNYSSVANRLELINTTDVATSSYVNVSGSKATVFTPQSNYNSLKISYPDQLSNNLNSTLSVGLQIPILNGLQLRSRVRQAQILEKRSNFEAQTTRTQLRQAIDQAYINMTNAFERYQTLARQVQDFTESFKAAEIRFNAGVNTSIEYLIAKNNVDKANSNFVSTKYDYLLRIKILDYYQGKPLW